MATIIATNAAPFGAITTYRAIHAVEAAVSSIKSWNSKRKTYNQLSALTARELDDIGMSRADIEYFRAM